MRLLCLLALAAPSLAFGQAARLVDRLDAEGVLLPPSSAATIQGPLALAMNPAGLALGPSGLAYLHEDAQRGLVGGRRADALFLSGGGLVAGGEGAFGAGLGVEWLRPPGGCGAADPCARRTSLSLSGGTPALALGVAYRWYQSDESAFLDDAGTLDLGLTWRPATWLSLGAVLQAANAPSSGTRTLARVGRLSLALRPGVDWVTLSADWRQDDQRDLDGARVEYGAFLGPASGIELGAQLSHTLEDPGAHVAFLLGARVGFGFASVFGAAGAPVTGGAGDDLGGSVGLELWDARGPELLGPSPTAQVLDLREALSGPSPFEQLLGEGRDGPVELVLRLERLLREPSGDTIVLLVRGIGDLSLGRIQELRGLVLEARARGRHVVAWLESGGDAEYYLASAAEKVWAAPQAMLLLNGLSSERFYLRGALDKLGVEPEFVKHGRYKSAPEQYTNERASDAAREQYEAILDDQFDRYVRAVAEARGMTPARVKELLDLGVFIAEDAAKAGLLDGVCASGKGLDPAIEQVAGRRLPRVEAGPDERAPSSWGRVPAIAVVTVKGNILGGDGAPGSPGADRLVRELRRAADDDDVAAIVLRVDSPGGEVGASELIHLAVAEARKKKPLVASFGDVAASGGYYVAAAADEIVAEPGSITGSIGVFAGKANLQPLLAKIGVSTETIRRGERADFFSLSRPWTDAERARMASVVDGFYETFLQRVADGRKMALDDVRAVAEGRVWTGAQAQARKLVDSLGGLDLALRRARDRAKLPADAPVRVVGTTGLYSLAGPAAPVEALIAGRALGEWRELIARGLMGVGLAPRLPARWEDGVALVVAALVEGRPLALATELPIVR